MQSYTNSACPFDISNIILNLRLKSIININRINT